MFYFGAFWRPGAFERFACSYDLVHWTTWQGEDLVASSEPYDSEYAHKPWVIKWNDGVYHFYHAVGEGGRVIALATSTDLRSSTMPALSESMFFSTHHETPPRDLVSFPWSGGGIRHAFPNQKKK